MELYADIIIDISHSKLDQTFQYRIPEELREVLEPGNVVEVPFGRGDRPIKGYVLRISDHTSCPPEKMKTILRLETDLAGAESKLTALALWIRDYYGSTTVQALRTVLPFRQKVSEKKKKWIELAITPEEAQQKLEIYRKKHQAARARLLEALMENPVLPQEIVTGSLKVTSAVWKPMQEQGIVRCETEQVYRTPAILEQLRREAQGTSGIEAETQHQNVLGTADDADNALERAEQRADEHNIIEDIQTESFGRKLNRDFTKEQTAEQKKPEDRQQETVQGKMQRFVLTQEQQYIVDTVREQWQQDSFAEYLIHGVTGSGKTAVYMELIAAALERGQQAILLIPEISLTYQNVIRFYKRFGDRISILHSRLSPAERYDQFERARSDDIDVMIGPRSALFTPFAKLGIIIMDEEHEPSYASETVPRYHARETARKRAMLEGARFVMGSATPSLEAYYAAQNGTCRLFTMKQRATGGVLPNVYTVDLRQELRDGNRSILSRLLYEKLEHCLAKGQQAMLFLNRRGYSGFVSCRSCGHVMKCPHCDVSLSLHKNGRLICHYCGHEEPSVKKCPKCESPYIGGFKAGTQQIEEAVAAAFPQAKILRMDADTTKGKDGHAEILRAFGAHEADILVGTQMIVKGHDFPNVTLVGILAADLSLHVSDYRAGERTFQLLTQAAGRAGRGTQAGEVVIQTYDPQHYAVTCAAEQAYEPFYEQEILHRKLAGYPPAGDMMAVHCACENQELLTIAVDYLAKFIRQVAGKYEAAVIGPSDETVARINDVYRKAMYVKHENPKVLTAVKNMAEQYIEINTGFREIRVNFERC